MNISVFNPQHVLTNYFLPQNTKPLSTPRTTSPKAGETQKPVNSLSSQLLFTDDYWHISRRQDYLDFSFKETYSQAERLSLNGYYAESSQTLSLNLKYIFQKKVMTDNGWQQRTFMLEFSFEKQQTEKLNANVSEEKESVAAYLKRLVNEIVETANDKDKLLLGARIDLEEFMEIAGIEDGKFIKMIHSLIQTIFNFTLQKLMKEEREAEPVMVEVERKKSHKMHLDYSQEMKNHFDMNIIDITGSHDEKNNIQASDAEQPTDK